MDNTFKEENAKISNKIAKFIDEPYKNIMGTFSDNAVEASNNILILQLVIIGVLYLYFLTKTRKKIENENSNIQQILGLFGINFLLVLFTWVAVIALGDFLFTAIENKSFTVYIQDYLDYRNNAMKAFFENDVGFPPYSTLISSNNPYRDFEHIKVLDLAFNFDIILVFILISSVFSLHRFLSASAKIKAEMKNINIILVLVTIMLFLAILKFS